MKLLIVFTLLAPFAIVASPEISFSAISPQQVVIGSHLLFTIVVTSSEQTPALTVTKWPPGVIHYDESIESGKLTGTIDYSPSSSGQFGSPYDVVFIASDGINPPVTNIMTVAVLSRIPGETVMAIANYSFSDGKFQFEMGSNQKSNASRIIQASTNLVDWVAIGTNSCGPGEICAFSDPNSGNFSRRYYRLLQSAETNLSVELP